MEPPLRRDRTHPRLPQSRRSPALPRQLEKFLAELGWREFNYPVPDKLIHQPWTAKPTQLAAAGVELGKTYPHPIVDHDKARRRALMNVRSLA